MDKVKPSSVESSLNPKFDLVAHSSGFWIRIFVGLFFLLVSIAILLFAIFSERAEYWWFILSYISFAVTALIFFISLFFLFKKMRSKRKLLPFLEDAVRLKASATLRDTRTNDSAYNPIVYKILVTFEYDGNEHSKISGYSATYLQYTIKKEIQIAYSPKYDEVFVLGHN